MALVPIRVYLIPRMPFTDAELEALDGPVASAFVSSPYNRKETKLIMRRLSNQSEVVCEVVQYNGRS